MKPETTRLINLGRLIIEISRKKSENTSVVFDDEGIIGFFRWLGKNHERVITWDKISTGVSGVAEAGAPEDGRLQSKRRTPVHTSHTGQI